MNTFNVIFTILATATIIEFSKKKHAHPISYTTTITIILLGGFRNFGGSDYLIYKDYFDKIDNPPHQYELLYYKLNELISFAHLNFNNFIFITSTFTIGFHCWFIKKNTSKAELGILFFYSTTFIWLDNILIRQSIASCFLLLSLSHMAVENKRIHAILYLITASLFHSSAAIAGTITIAIFLTKNKIVPFLVIILIPLITLPSEFENIIRITNNEIISNPNVVQYLNNSEGTSSANIIELFLAWASLRRLRKTTISKREIWNAALMSALLFTIASFKIPALARFIEYYRIIYIIIITEYISNINGLEKKFAIGAALLYCLIRLNNFTQNFDNGITYTSYLFS